MLPADSPFASLPAPGPHPATAELRAYAAGSLPLADEHRIEAHTLACERCAELLEGFSMSDASTTDQALAGLRTRLQARVADDITAPVLLPASRPLWPRLAAAAALLGVVAGGIWGWEQRSTPDTVTMDRTETKSVKPVAPATTIASATPTLPSPPVLGPIERPVLPTRPVNRPPIYPSLGSGRQADYAAVGHHQAAGSSRFHRLAAPAAPGLAEQNTEVADEAASQAVPATPEAKQLAGRTATLSASKPATSAATAEAAAPKVAVALPALPTEAPARPDSSATGQQEVISSRFSKAKAIESAAFVRDKPMPPVMSIAPAPVAGTPALRAYLHSETARFEPEEGAKPLHGTVRLRFIVGADGKLSNLQVVRGIRADYDEEALRLVCEGPAWRPGIAGGRRADLPMEITISF